MGGGLKPTLLLAIQAEIIELLLVFVLGKVASMAVTTFEMDDRMLAKVRELQEVFGVRTNAAVLRKAIALASAAATKATPEHTVTISGRDEPLTISLIT
jgi:hypothetical protein